jgi:hypothetical protein
MLCIPQFEKTWKKGKAKILQQEVLVTILFMDNKALYFLKINTAVITQQSFKPIQSGFIRLTKIMQSTVRIVTKHLNEYLHQIIACIKIIM